MKNTLLPPANILFTMSMNRASPSCSFKKENYLFRTGLVNCL